MPVSLGQYCFYCDNIQELKQNIYRVKLISIWIYYDTAQTYFYENKKEAIKVLNVFRVREREPFRYDTHLHNSLARYGHRPNIHWYQRRAQKCFSTTEGSTSSWQNQVVI